MGQIFFRCQGKIFQRSLTPVALFPANERTFSPFDSNVQIQNSEKTLKEIAESLSEEIQLQEDEEFHFLAATETGAYDISRKIIDFGPDTYFVAKIKEKLICIIFPLGITSN